MFNSLKAKIVVLTIALITCLFGIIIIVNNLFIERYYQAKKVDDIVNAYYSIDTIMNDYDNEKLDDEQLHFQILGSTNPLGASLFIMDSGWNTVYSSKFEAKDERERIKENVFRRNISETFVIKSDEKFTVQKAYDKRLKDHYIELVGSLSDGNTIIIRMPIESIKESIKITNRFIFIVGSLVMLFSLLVVYIFATYITVPIKALSGIAKKMSDLDFSVKYTGKDKSEIGHLGRSMNILSKNLEKNIGDLKTANLELQKDLEKNKKIEEMKNDFIGNVSHELKTPIALIQGYAEGLKDGVVNNPEDINFYCDVILDEADKMNQMVKKLLTLNQLEAESELQIERFNLTELVRNIIDSNNIRTEQKNIKIIFNCKKDYYVWSDEYKIEEVIVNYLSNAINHCENEKIIEISIKKQDSKIRVSVFNTGKVIPKDCLDKLWDKFYKVDKARTREYGGNGLGLSIVKAIMESLNNDYGVINHSNGVEFYFELDSD